MKRKSNRTMEMYVEAGAYARLLSDIGTKAVVSMSQILPAKETDKMVSLLNRIDEVKCKADDQLFRDYPNLSNEGTDVFYGTLSTEPRNDLDAEVISTAQQKVWALFDDPSCKAQKGFGDAD